MSDVLRKAVVLLFLVITAVSQAVASSPADSLVIRFANRTRLVIYAPDKAGIQALSNYDLNKIVREMGMKLDSVPGGQTAILQDGERYLKDTVLVITKKKDGVTVVINGSDDVKADSTRRQDQDYQKERKKNRSKSWDFDYGGSIGLNSFIQQGPNPSYPEDSYDLRPIGSRYVSLAMGAKPTLIKGKRASLKLYYGIEVAWNNFMFDGNNVAETTPTGVVFTDVGRALQKSKLTVCTIGIPVVPRVTFYSSSGRRLGHIGLGGFINYRLDSYRKIKEADGKKDRRHENFGLTNYRYGLMAHIGIKGADFFIKYDLSPLFALGKGPDVRALSFGFGF
ncbi:outer membrane beta-barrel protein [Spirosoma fluminis]